MCAGYSDHYTWPDPSQLQQKDSKMSKSSKSAVPNFLDSAESQIIPYHLVGKCKDLRFDT